MVDSSGTNGRQILIVDDDKDVRKLLTDLLAENGYRTATATTGAEAIAAVADEKKRPDLVMMDVKLPDQDGLAVLRQLKREHDQLEVIVMTAFGGSSTRDQGHGARRLRLRHQAVRDRRPARHAEAGLRARRHELRGQHTSTGARQERGRARAHRRRVEADAGGLQAHRQGRQSATPPSSSPASRAPARSSSPRRCIGPASATPIRSSRSAAPRCRRRSSRPSCSATRRARSPAR